MKFTTDQCQKLVAIARGEIGVKEEGGNNRGKKIQEYQSATWLDGTGWPWCAAFVDWCIKTWKEQNPDLPAFQRPLTAGAFDLERWARKTGLIIKDSGDAPEAGDIVIYDFGGHGHCGILDYSLTKGQFLTVEANTNKDGSHDGDGVWSKMRTTQFVKCFLSWPKKDSA